MNAAPVMGWSPPLCGTMDLVIRADGVWMHEGSPIGRPELVRLFASILKYEDSAYFLVSPVEKLQIAVEDLPLRIIAAARIDGMIWVRSDGGDEVALSDAHALVVDADDPRPRVHIRHGLWARVIRSVYYDLVGWAEVAASGQVVLGSGDSRFVLGDSL